MKQHQQVLNFETEPKWFIDITGAVSEVVSQAGVGTGLCTLFVPHTSASLIIQENTDPAVMRDLVAFMSKLVPEHHRYRHGIEGPDDMPAHIRSTLTSTSEQIPIAKGRLTLGSWQGLYLWEHRQKPHTRQVMVHVVGD